jgi:hypothetical protein
LYKQNIMNTNLSTYTKTFDFSSYKLFINELAQNDLCTGDLSEEHVQATKLNAHRIKRIDRQIEIIPQLKNTVQSIIDNWEWLILIESWCGDGAQNLPIIAKIASLSDKIKLTIILRDENPSIMDSHLTNGARAIPKLICINQKSKKELGSWGPRPANIQEKVKKIKSDNPLISHDEFGRNLHLWYAKDRGLSLQNEFISLINQWNETSQA